MNKEFIKNYEKIYNRLSDAIDNLKDSMKDIERAFDNLTHPNDIELESSDEDEDK